MYSVRCSYTLKPEHNDFNNTSLALKKSILLNSFQFITWNGRDVKNAYMKLNEACVWNAIWISRITRKILKLCRNILEYSIRTIFYFCWQNYQFVRIEYSKILLQNFKIFLVILEVQIAFHTHASFNFS